jgi:hypothetical protein
VFSTPALTWLDRNVFVFHHFDDLFNFSIICTDERYQEDRNLVYMSKWLRGAIKKYNSFQDTMNEMQKFFQNAQVLQLL